MVRKYIGISVAALAVASHVCKAQQVDEEIEVVESSPLKHTLLESVHPVSIIDGDELRAKTEQNLGETLAGELGVHADSFGPGAARPTIRGFERSRVKVMENGIDAMDASTVSADHAVGLEASNATRIEVVRGPETLAYGSNAVGGVINVLNHRIPTAVTAPFTGSASAQFGSNADEQAYVVDLSGRAGALGWHVDAAHRRADDMEIPGFAEVDPDDDEQPGRVENSAYDTDSIAAGLAWSSDRFELGFSVSRLNTDYGIPGHGHEEEGEEHEEEEEHEGEEHEEDEHEEDEDEHGHEEGEEESVRIDLEQTRYDLKAALLQPASGIDSITLRVGINDYTHQELEGTEIGTRFDNQEVEARLELVHDALLGFDGALGVQFGDRDFSAIGEEAFVPPNQTRRWAVFWIGSSKLGEKLTLEGGLRAERQKLDASTGLSSTHNALSLSFGLAWEVGAATYITANLQRAQRNPGSEELFSDGLHVATNSFEIGDPNLDTETNTAIDVGFRGNREILSWEAYAFYNDYRDYIYLAPTGELAEGAPVFNYRQADAEFYGFEAAVAAHFMETASGASKVSLFADYTRAKLKGGGDLPRIPPLRAGVEIEADYGPWRAAVTAARYARQDKVAALETATDGYTIIGFDIGYRIAAGDMNWNLFLRGRNVADRMGRRHQSRLKDLVPIKGRNIVAGLRVDW